MLIKDNVLPAEGNYFVMLVLCLSICSLMHILGWSWHNTFLQLFTRLLAGIQPWNQNERKPCCPIKQWQNGCAIQVCYFTLYNIKIISSSSQSLSSWCYGSVKKSPVHEPTFLPFRIIMLTGSATQISLAWICPIPKFSDL